MEEEGLDARKSCSFVFGEVKNCVEPDHFQQHHYPLIRREVGAFSARALQRGERTNECPNPRLSSSVTPARFTAMCVVPASMSC